jgi:hypothetical protein
MSLPREARLPIPIRSRCLKTYTLKLCTFLANRVLMEQWTSNTRIDKTGLDRAPPRQVAFNRTGFKLLDPPLRTLHVYHATFDNPTFRTLLWLRNIYPMESQRMKNLSWVKE